MTPPSSDWAAYRQAIYKSWRIGDLVAARKLLEQSSRDHPDLIEVTLGLAQQTAMELPPDAPRDSVLALLDIAAQQDGKDELSNVVAQAVMRYEAHDFAGTRPLLREAVRGAADLLPGSFGQLSYLLGMIAYDDGAYDKAEEGFRLAFASDPGVPSYSVNLIQSLRQQGKEAEAEAVLRAALKESSPKDRAELKLRFSPSVS